MYESPNMGLNIWDQLDDDFEHSQLVDNWVALDDHDHAPGHGRPIGAAGLQDGAVTQNKLAEGSVGNAQIQIGAVSSDDLQDGSVTHAKIATGAVYDESIKDGGVGITKLDPTIVPLGQIVLWWRPPQSNAVPGGFWEIMDGRPWDRITNAWGLTQGHIPDMRSRFPVGADTAPSVFFPGIGQQYGSDVIDLAHVHGVAPHGHTVPPHRHGIQSDGSHNHRYGPSGLLDIWSRPNALPMRTSVTTYAGGQVTANRFSLYIKNLEGDIADPDVPPDQQDVRVAMTFAGDHNHGRVTDFSGDVATSGNPGLITNPPSWLDTNNPSSTFSLAPLSIGLMYIMRVR